MGSNALVPGRLNDRERRFCEAWVADPEHNATSAARLAGYTGKPGTLAANASRLLKRDKVQAYIASLRAQAIAAVAVETDSTVLTLKECLKAATAIVQVDIPSLYSNGEPDWSKVEAMPVEQRRALQVESQHTTDAEGQSFARYKFKRDPVTVAAAKLLVEHYEGAKNPGPQVNIGQVLVNLPAGTAREVGKALLAQGSIDTTAKVIE